MNAIAYLCILAPLLQVGLAINEETDLISLSLNYDDGVDDIANPEIWNSKEYVVFDSVSKPLLQEICKDANKLVYVTHEDVTIDCKNFSEEESPEEDAHRVIKRAADELQEVGSGEGDIMETAPESTIPPPSSTAASIEPVKEEEITGTEQETKLKEDTIPVIQEKSTTIEEQPISETPTPKTTTISPPTTIAASIEPEKRTVKEEIIRTEQETTTIKSAETTMKEITTTLTQEKNTKTEEQPIPAIEPKENEDMPKGGDKSEPKDPKTDAEIIHGRTLVNSRTKEATKESDSEDTIQTKESTEETKKAGSKDTTILVVLFVAVVVVGALAFGYNFIKKRRQQSADLERVERASPLKRSFQNLTKTTEGEAEKNPLLDDSKEIEMKDMKKATLENGEKPSESNVKS